MAVDAIPFQVIFVQHESSDGVPEVVMVPSSMTGIAMTVQLADLLSGRVTRSALKLIVVAVQRESGSCVREGGLALGVVAVTAVLLEVTVSADLVLFCLSFEQLPGVSHIMTVTAILLCMAVHALESE